MVTIQPTMTLFEKAKARMLFRQIFFATLILRTPIVFTKSTPRACTDMKRIYMNQDFIDSLPVKVIMFVLAHEMFHIILKHGLRMGGRHPRVWNWACDFAINLQLREAGFELWVDCLINDGFTGMSAEQIYDIIIKDPMKYVGKNPGKPEKFGTTRDENRCPIDDQDGEYDDLMDPGMMDEAEKRKLEREIDGMIASAMTQARQAGKMPAGIELLMQGEIDPPQPWLSLFNQYLTRVVRDQSSWSRRNRRFSDIVLPTSHNPGMGVVAVVGDTSGSMLGYQIFPQVEYEVNMMAEHARPERIVVVWSDASDCAHEEIFEPGENVRLHPRGGGGTDMRKPLAYVEKHEPEVVVLVTDAETPWPDKPTPFPLIILTTTAQATPRWATTIRIR